MNQIKLFFCMSLHVHFHIEKSFGGLWLTKTFWGKTVNEADAKWNPLCFLLSETFCRPGISFLRE